MGISVIGGSAGGGAALPQGTSAFLNRTSGTGALTLPALSSGTRYAIKVNQGKGMVRLTASNEDFYPDENGWIYFTPTSAETTAKLLPVWNEVYRTQATGGQTYSSMQCNGAIVNYDGSVSLQVSWQKYSGGNWYGMHRVSRDGNQSGARVFSSSTPIYYPLAVNRSGRTLMADTNGTAWYSTAEDGVFQQNGNVGYTGTNYYPTNTVYANNGRYAYSFAMRQSNQSIIFYQNGSESSWTFQGSGVSNAPTIAYMDKARDKVITAHYNYTYIHTGPLSGPFNSGFNFPAAVYGVGYDKTRGVLLAQRSSGTTTWYFTDDFGANVTTITANTGRYFNNVLHLGGTCWLGLVKDDGAGMISYDDGANWEQAPDGMKTTMSDKGLDYQNLLAPTNRDNEFVVVGNSDGAEVSYQAGYFVAYLGGEMSYELYEAADS